MKSINSASRALVLILLLFWYGLGIASAVAQSPSAGSATDYPSRTIHLVVTVPPGGALDVVARLIAQDLGERLGQPVVVDNRPGASGMIGAQTVAHATPDGYTLLFDSLTSQAVNPHLFTKITYNTRRDLVQLGVVARNPHILVGNPSLPAKLQDVLALAKKQPGYVTYASFGFGSSAHLAGEVFQQLAAVKLRHIPYKGAPPALTDLMSGQVMLMFSPLAPALALVKSGKLHAYGMATTQRSSLLPELPTIGEILGYANFDVATELGVMAPGGTPREILNRLHDEIVAIMATHDFQERLKTLGFMDSPPHTLEEMAAHYDAEYQRWGVVIKNAGIKPQ